jgi:hypothetical protein
MSYAYDTHTHLSTIEIKFAAPLGPQFAEICTMVVVGAESQPSCRSRREAASDCRAGVEDADLERRRIRRIPQPVLGDRLFDLGVE